MKKNYFKKIIAIIMSVLLFVTMSVPCFAAEHDKIINIETLTRDILSGDFSDLFMLTGAFIDAGNETGLFESVVKLSASFFEMMSEFVILITGFIF